MDYRERLNAHEEALRSAIEGKLRGVWTALPGIIETVDFEKLTCTVQPAIQAQVFDQEGKSTFVNLPVLPDVPIMFPRGGDYTLTFPIQQGDECLVILASRAIDNWWAQGGVQTPYDGRMHNLSDGFALVGPFSQPQKISNVPSYSTQLRSSDQRTMVELDGSHGQVTVRSPNLLILDAPMVTITGQLAVQNRQGVATPAQVTGSLHVSEDLQADRDVLAVGNMAAAGDMAAGNVSVRHHVHSNSGGTGNSGPPVGG